MKVEDCRLKIGHSLWPVSNLKSEIRNLKSEISNLKSPIRNPQSAIRNPQSAIRNPPFSPSPRFGAHAGLKIAAGEREVQPFDDSVEKQAALLG